MNALLLLGLPTNAYQCPNGGPVVDLSLDLAIVQDYNATVQKYSEDLKEFWAELVEQVNDEFNVDVNGNSVSDRVTYSFHRTTDKKLGYFNCSFNNWCLCNDTFVEDDKSKYTFDQLQCQTDESTCGVIDDFLYQEWATIYGRDLLDAPLDIAQSYFHVPVLDEKTKKHKIRVTAIFAEDCSHESGRSTTDPELQAEYWGNFDQDTRDMWLANPGIDEYGKVLEPDCNIRDYPTMNEFMNAMKASGTGLAVAYRGGEDSKCGYQSYNGYTRFAFYSEYMADAAEEHGVPYMSTPWSDEALATSSMDFFDSIAKLVHEIACVPSDVSECCGCCCDCD